MAFAVPGACYLFIPAAFLTASAANAGFVAAVFNRRYELMPDENRIVYDNFYTAAIGIFLFPKAKKERGVPAMILPETLDSVKRHSQ